jgi:hypothetical protein
VGGGRVEQASPWRAGNGEGDGCDADDGECVDTGGLRGCAVLLKVMAGLGVHR